MKRILFFLITLCACAPAFAIDRYQFIATTSGAAALTVQQPISGARRITFGDATVPSLLVNCAANQTITISWNGTAASSTTGTEKKLAGTANASGATVWTASNVGSGTTGAVYHALAGVDSLINLTWFVLQGNGNTNNLTATTSGTCTLTFSYSADAPR